jgi:hypothetical protein
MATTTTTVGGDNSNNTSRKRCKALDDISASEPHHTSRKVRDIVNDYWNTVAAGGKERLSFLAGMHPSCGRGSPVRYLPPYVARNIIEMVHPLTRATAISHEEDEGTLTLWNVLDTSVPIYNFEPIFTWNLEPIKKDIGLTVPKLTLFKHIPMEYVAVFTVTTKRSICNCYIFNLDREIPVLIGCIIGDVEHIRTKKEPICFIKDDIFAVVPNTKELFLFSKSGSCKRLRNCWDCGKIHSICHLKHAVLVRSMTGEMFYISTKCIGVDTMYNIPFQIYTVVNSYPETDGIIAVNHVNYGITACHMVGNTADRTKTYHIGRPRHNGIVRIYSLGGIVIQYVKSKPQADETTFFDICAPPMNPESMIQCPHFDEKITELPAIRITFADLVMDHGKYSRRVKVLPIFDDVCAIAIWCKLGGAYYDGFTILWLSRDIRGTIKRSETYVTGGHPKHVYGLNRAAGIALVCIKNDAGAYANRVLNIKDGSTINLYNNKKMVGITK